MARLIDQGAAQGDMTFVIHTGLLMLGVVALGAVFATTRNISASIASQSLGADLREDLFVKIQSLSITQMERYEGGSLVTRNTNDITQLTNFINGLMRIFFKAPIVLIGAIVMSIRLSRQTIPIILPIVIMISIVIVLSMRLTYPRFAKVQLSLDQLNTTMREYLSGIRLVKAFRRFQTEEKRFDEANDRLTEDTVKANQILVVLSPFMTFFVNVGIAVVLYVGSFWMSNDQIQIGSVMAFISYMSQILFSIGMISNVLNMFVRVKTSNERIREVMLETVENSTDHTYSQLNLDSHQEPLSDRAFIQFDQVGFSYAESTGQAALHNVNLTIQKGEIIGVIGSTGSGKSTITSLLMGFYPVTVGAIRISGQLIQDITTKTLHQTIAIVPQAASLFSGTIKDNIKWGNYDATDKEVIEASKCAQAHEFISLMSEGYDSVLGQAGVNLSGGQKQRISIARALIRKPQILILDDCTSALDVITEAKVKKGIRTYFEEITCLLITQRVTTAMTCDRILVLENGEQVGFATHDELMKENSVYQDIYRSQLG